jgi:hypothetical protein
MDRQDQAASRAHVERRCQGRRRSACSITLSFYSRHLYFYFFAARGAGRRVARFSAIVRHQSGDIHQQDPSAEAHDAWPLIASSTTLASVCLPLVVDIDANNSIVINFLFVSRARIVREEQN